MGISARTRSASTGGRWIDGRHRVERRQPASQNTSTTFAFRYECCTRGDLMFSAYVSCEPGFHGCFQGQRTSRRRRSGYASLVGIAQSFVFQERHMKRREFISLLGGAAAAWPLAARAQEPGRIRRIGVLMGFASSDSEAQPRIAAFQRELQNLGWTVGRDLKIEYRWASGDAEL